MRNTTLAVVIPSMLLGVVVAQADPWIDGGVDSDGDGSLSQAEWSQVAPTLSASFNALDVNGDGQLTREEFTAWHDSLKARMGTDDLSTPAAAPDHDAIEDRQEVVSSAQGTVNKQSTSGEYYPNSVGTVGDDPAKPKTTSVPADAQVKASDKDSGAPDKWMDDGADLDGDGYLSLAELTKISPTLSESFGAIDIDSDERISHSEFRSWHESMKAKMGAE